MTGPDATEPTHSGGPTVGRRGYRVVSTVVVVALIAGVLFTWLSGVPFTTAAPYIFGACAVAAVALAWFSRRTGGSAQYRREEQ